MFALGTRLTPLRIPTSRARVHRGRGLAARPARVPAASPAQPGPASLEGQTPVGDEPFSLGLRRDAEDALELGEPLGRGAMGVVRLATRKRDGCRFALKTIPKSGPASLEGQTPVGDAMSVWERKVRDEVNLHFALGASLDIVTLHDGFEDEAGVHLLIDLCDGGDLLTGAGKAHSSNDSSSDASNLGAETSEEEDAERAGECWKPFSEATAAPMIRGMLRALAACHEHGVVHRDVKPANFLFMREPDGSRRVKLSDFGLAARIRAADQKLTEQCGTYAYLSPEMARGRPYDFKVDAWAAGVVAYMLLAGEPPFADWDAIRERRAPTKHGLLRNVRRGKPETPVDHLPLSPGARSLLSSLLTVDPDKRMSCAEAAEHYWVREKGVASHADALANTVVERLQAYGTLGAVRRASIRAAFEATSSASFSASVDGDVTAATARLVRVVEKAAEEACANHDECDVGDDVDFETGVSVDALMLALRDHGAELAPEEWSSLIRPVAGRAAGEPDGGSGAFVNNAALAAILATPAGGSFSRRLDAESNDDQDVVGSIPGDEETGIRSAASDASFDWNAVAEASFRRLLEKTKSGSGVDAESPDQLEETVSFEDVADEVCAWDGSEELCRATLKEEFDAADADNDGKLGIAEWTDLVWSEGLMDGSGRVRSACGADAPAPDPSGPVPAGVGAPGCDLAPEESVRRPPTELSPREKARAAAEARRKMAAQRAARRANRRG